MLLEQAVELGKINLAEDDPDVLATAYELGKVLQQGDDPMAARRVLEEAYAAGQWRLGDSDPLMLQISHDIGVVAEELGNRHEARKAFSRVAELGPGVLGGGHWAVTRAQAYLGPEQADDRVPPAPPDRVGDAPTTVFEAVPPQVRAGSATGQPVWAEGAGPTVAQPVAAPRPGRGQPTPPSPFGGPQVPVQRSGPSVPVAPFSGPDHSPGPAEVLPDALGVSPYGEPETAVGGHAYPPAPSSRGHLGAPPQDGYAYPSAPSSGPGAAYGQGPWGAPGYVAAPGAGQVFAPAYPSGGSGRRGLGIFAAVAAVLAAVMAVAALVFVLANRTGDSSDNDNVPTLAGPAPTDVRLRDGGAVVDVRWQDPTESSVSFMVIMGRPGQELKPVGTLGPGQTSFEMTGLNATVNYCFAVVAVYSGDQFATSPQACTSRASATPR